MGTNEIRVPINVTGEDQAARDIKKVEKSVEDLGDSLGGLGEKSTEVSKETEKTGEKLKGTAEDAGFLKQRVDELNVSLEELVKRLNATGDTSLEKDIRKTERESRKYKKLLKTLVDDAEAAAAAAATAAGGAVTDGLAEGFKTGAEGLKGAAIPLLVGIAAAAAPMVGATLNAAVLGGVGAGGIIGGVAAAMQDPFIKQAAASLGASLTADFTHMGTSNFSGPLLEAFGTLEQAGHNLAQGLAPGMRALAPLLTPLANGLEGLATQALPGLNKAMAAAAPVLRVVAAHLPEIGSALGQMFGDMADSSDGAIMGMDHLLRLTEGLIRGTGKFVAILSDVFEWSARAAEGATDFLSTIYGWIPVVGDFFEGQHTELKHVVDGLGSAKSGAGDFGGALEHMGKSAEESAAEVQALQQAIDDLFGNTMGLEQAEVAAAQGMRTLVEELKDGPRVIDKLSQAGLDNRAALDAQITAWNAVREAQIAANVPMAQANASFQAQIDKLTELGHSLGFRGKDFDAFMAKWRSIPDLAVKKFIFSFEAQSTVGATAWSMWRAHERGQARASGGPVSGGMSYLVGERGPELVTFGRDGMVHSAADTRSLMSGQSGGAALGAWGGGGALQVDVTHQWVGPPGAAGDLGEAFARFIRSDVKVRGAGSVQSAYGES